MQTVDFAKALAEIQVAPPVYQRTASDDDVLLKLRALAAYGFRPDPKHVEPVRDFLSGYGVLLSGDTGSGKTFFFTALGVPVRSSRSIAAYGRNVWEWINTYAAHDVCIDDLGAEPVTSDYGNKADVLGEVIAAREHAGHVRTHVTTNLTSAQISERYGHRTLSRLLGMCRAHRWQGPSLRRPTPLVVRDLRDADHAAVQADAAANELQSALDARAL